MKSNLGFLLFASFIALGTKASEVGEISNANDKFSIRLYNDFEGRGGNLLYSPISVHVILSLLQQGAVGETARNMQNALYLPDSRSTVEGYKTLMERLNSAQNVTLHIANKVYVNPRGILKREFSDIATINFLAEAETINFEDRSSAAQRINSWVVDKTNGKISDVISPNDLSRDTGMILVNAIYFKGDWLYKFEKKNTKTKEFYLSETDTVDCNMMNILTKLKYTEDDDLDAQIVSLSYRNTNLGMTIILPKSKTGINDLERKLQTKSLSSLSRNLYEANVDLYLPKFKIETTMDLYGPLQQAGLSIIFTDNANFSNVMVFPQEFLDTSTKLKVNKIVQKAFIEVNEEGAEAAAATAIQSFHALPAPPQKPVIITFRADHPFIFMLTYRGEEIVPLFVGKLEKP